MMMDRGTTGVGSAASFRSSHVPLRFLPAGLLLMCLMASLGPHGMSGILSVPAAAAATVEIYYAPEDLPGDRLAALYEKARRYIYVAVYGFTYPPIVKALVAAKKRGVDVRVITDREKLNDPKQRAALKTLRLAGIPILINRHDGLMHMKQVVVDDEVNTSGSMNQTGSGNRYNDERLDVITDPVTTAEARDKFLSMWKDAERYQEWR
jgi:phosphatidylserine/phosphatidylglycerophosphate/cardiolipin synthase-like enzyme